MLFQTKIFYLSKLIGIMNKKGGLSMGIPKPLVQTNQLFIVLTTLAGLLFSSWILLLPIVIGVTTLISKRNPLIMAGRRLLPKRSYQMEDAAQQLFNQWIATICLIVSFLSFQFDLSVLGYTFGIMVILAAGVALMGYCIGCTIRYRYMMWRYKRKQAA